MTRVCSIIPISQHYGRYDLLLRSIGGTQSALERTVHALSADVVDDHQIIISTDVTEVKEFVEQKSLNAQVVLRKEEDYVDALRDAFSTVKMTSGDVILAEATHPFRPSGLFLRLLENWRNKPRLESIICAREIDSRIWQVNSDKTITPVENRQLGAGAPAKYFEECMGLGSVTSCDMIFKGKVRGDSIGFEIVNSIWASVDINSDEAFETATALSSVIS